MSDIPYIKNMSDMLEPKEVDIPSKYETFEAQVVIKTQPHKETIYPYVMPATHPLAEAHRVIKSGRFHADLLLPQLVGKPALIITEEKVSPHALQSSATEEKSDGRLGECLRVYYDENLIDPGDTGNDMTYQGVRIAARYGYMPLTPEQALSLLVWLEQEKSTLERMVKETKIG